MLLLLYYIGILLSTASSLENSPTKPSQKRSLPFSKENLSENDDKTILAYVNFECKGRSKGYYVDHEFDCVVFHFCDDFNKRYSYKCKGGKRFDQVTSTCTFFSVKECKQKSNNINETERERSLLTNFKKKNVIEKHSNSKPENSDEDLEALSAFASLSQSMEHKSKKEEDIFGSGSNIVNRKVLRPSESSRSKSGRKQDISLALSPNSYSVYDLKIPSRSPSVFSTIRRSDIQESANEKSEVFAQPSSDQRFYDNYYPLSQTSNGPPNSAALGTTPYPVFHSSPLQRSGFDPHPAIIENLKHIDKKFPHFDHHNNGNPFNPFPKSHFNFSPPGSILTVEHPNIKTSYGNDIHVPHNIHIPHLGNDYKKSFHKKPKPPSIFGSPSPSPIILNSPSPPHPPPPPPHGFGNHPTFFDEFHKNPFGNLPQTTPHFYTNSLQYPNIPNTQNYHLYNNAPYSINPHLGIPHINHASGIPHSNIGVTNEFYHPVNLPIKTSHKTVKIDKTKNTGEDIEHNLLANISHQPLKEEKLKDIDSTLHVSNPPKRVIEDDNALLKPKKKLISSRGQVTTRNRPRTKFINTPKPVVRDDNEEIVKEIEHEPIPVLTTPVTRVSSTATTSSRGLRRKPHRTNTFSKIKNEQLQSHITPTKLIEEDLENYDTGDEELDYNAPVVAEAESPKTTTTTTTTVKPTIKPVKPPVLRGNLKDRLNRLGTRRRTLSQGRLKSQGSDRAEDPTSIVNDDPTQEIVTAKVQRIRKLPVIKKQEETTVGVTPTNSDEPKKRITNFFKERSQSRRRPLRPAQKRVEDIKVVKKEDIILNESENIKSDVINTEELSNVETKSPEIKNPVSNDNISGGQRKRKMNPDVRARFKEFLKNRKSRLTSNTEIVTKEDVTPEKSKNKEEIIPEESLPNEALPNEEVLHDGIFSKESKPEEEFLEETLPTDAELPNKNMAEEPHGHEETEEHQHDENDTTHSHVGDESDPTSEIDIAALESRTMEKSVPLVREEKVILLENPYDYPFEARQKRLSYGRNKSNPTSYDIHSILSHPSAKPFRYMLNKTRYKKTMKPQDQQQMEHHNEDYQNDEGEISTAKPLPGYSKVREKLFPSEPPSITTHKVVSPTNFKQIVRMHPKIPNSIPSNPQNTDKEVKEQNQSINENEVYAIDVSGTPGNTHIRNNSMPILSSELLYEDKVYQGADIDLSTDNEEDETIRVSKPVFNLDSILRPNLNDRTSHISALDTKDYKEKLSSIRFEPFSISNDEPMLPIEKLLKLTSS